MTSNDLARLGVGKEEAYVEFKSIHDNIPREGELVCHVYTWASGVGTFTRLKSAY